MRGLFIATAGLLLIAACSAGPAPEIVGQSATGSGSLFGDATVQVECEIRNAGDTGNVIVTAFVEAQNGALLKRQISVINGGKTRVFTFDFPEFEYRLLGGDSFEFSCGLE